MPVAAYVRAMDAWQGPQAEESAARTAYASAIRKNTCRHECRHGTQECVRHIRTYWSAGSALCTNVAKSFFSFVCESLSMYNM